MLPAGALDIGFPSEKKKKKKGINAHIQINS